MDWTAKIHFGGKLRGVRVEGSEKPSVTRALGGAMRRGARLHTAQ